MPCLSSSPGAVSKESLGRDQEGEVPAPCSQQPWPSRELLPRGLPGRGRATALTRGGLSLTSTDCQSEVCALAVHDTRPRSEEVLEYFRVSQLGQQVTTHMPNMQWQLHPALFGMTLPTYSPSPQPLLLPAEAPWVSQEVVLVYSQGLVVSSKLCFQHSPSENNLSSSSCP